MFTFKQYDPVQALSWLKANNLLYKDIVVDINNIDNTLITLQYDDKNQQASTNNITLTDSDPKQQTDYNRRQSVKRKYCGRK